MRLIFDIESDELLKNCTRMWMLIAHDVTNNERYEYLEGDLGWKDLLNQASHVIGHNLIGFDLAVLKKLFGYELPKHVSIHDTQLMSQIQNYRRFGYKGHSLKVWGEMFDLPKGDFTEFTGWIEGTSEYGSEEEWHEAMRIYAHRDVELTCLVYKYLIDEFREISSKEEYFKTYITAEHYAARWQSDAQLYGWPFDKEKAIPLYEKVTIQLKEIQEKLEPLLRQ